jgi:hypothetical protein
MADPVEGEGLSASRACRFTFVATILAGSFLLFLVQPMVARMALPRLGGAPAVWNSAMLVYQTLLLAGYAYAHALARIRPWLQAVVHLCVLAIGLIWLPIGLALTGGPTSVSPALWVPWLLGASIGPLFFAVSAQAPLVQRWFSIASRGGDPYALYAASNLGSFGGLIAYPLIVEPLLALRQQSLLWSGGYLLLIALVAACALRLPRAASGETARPTSAPATRGRVLHWIVLALVPSGLMLATSTYITTDIVAMPLLWVLPLGLYLLSFTIAFAANREIADVLTRIAPITILLFGGIMIGGINEQPLVNLAIALTLLFMVSVSLHTKMYRLRPDPDRLTGFYLAMAFGGAAGGAFAGLIAPVVFDWTYEYPLLIFSAGLLVPQVYLTSRIRRLWMTPRSRMIAQVVIVGVLLVLAGLTFRGPAELFGEGHQGLTFIVIAAVGVLSVGARASYALILAVTLVIFGGWRAVELSLEQGARTRSYFGVYTVRDSHNVRELDHGTTVHGIQFTGSPVLERLPTTYYAPPSGIGQAMGALDRLYGRRARVGVVGLGTGTLACYAQSRQRWRFYEIDPVVVRIARDTGQFSYLKNCLPNPTIRIGDARLSLEQDAPASLDLLALDAFSSDAIPMHLMTREAFASYARVLQPRGLLLVHISNRFLDLEPVVAALAADGGWHAAKLYYQPPKHAAIASASQWIALTRDPATLRALAAGDPQWLPLTRKPGIAAWTDDYSTILPLLKWRR